MAEGGCLKMDNGHDEPPTSMNLASPENFSQVAFTNIEPYYPPNTDIICAIRKIRGFQSGKKDWVGIFKVGWQTTKEYYTWVSVDGSRDGHVLFKAYYLPKDEEYYQFCYVDHTGEVRGISVPFQFRAQLSEDENDLVLVTTEEEIERINDEKRMLKEENQTQAELIQILQGELRSTSEKLKTKEKENQKENQTQVELIQILQGKLRSTSEKLETKERENQDLQFQLQSLATENESLKKNTFEADLEQSKIKVEELLVEVKEMHTQQDQMEAEKIQLQSENMAKQEALENTTGVMEKYKEEVARLKVELKNEKEQALENTNRLMERNKEEFARMKAELENKKLADETNKIKELQEQLRSTEQNTVTLERRLSSLESEKVTKGEELIKLSSNIAHLEFELTTLRDGSKQHLRTIEKKNKENASLDESLDRQSKKLAYAENTIRELQTQLRSTRQTMTSLEVKVASLEDENMNKTEEVRALQNAIDLRNEEVEDLNTARMRNQAEIDELNKQLRQAHLSAATAPIRPSPSWTSPLYYGNLYEEPHSSSIMRENEPLRSFETTLVQENRPSATKLKCPICSEEFSGDDVQVYEDHVMCHETSLVPTEMNCPFCSEVFMGDTQMYNDHIMCHTLEI